MDSFSVALFTFVVNTFLLIFVLLVSFVLIKVIVTPSKGQLKWEAFLKSAPKREKKKQTLDLTYRSSKEKEMYRRLAMEDEKEARLENEIRDRLRLKVRR